MIMAVLYLASAHMGILAALMPTSAAPASFIDEYAKSQCLKYAGNDPIGEKITSQKAFAWRHEIWSGNDRPYHQARQEIDAAIAAGESPMRIAESYQKQAQENKQSPLAQFRWSYALWKTITPTSTSSEKQTNGLGAFFALAKIASPNTYNYARLRYLVSYHSSDLTELGERLLLRDRQDVSVKAHLALDYTTPGPEPYNLKDKNRVIQLSKELIQANPNYPNYYAVLAEGYTTNYFMNGHHRQDGLAMIAALKKYLDLAKPNESFYQDAKARLSDMERRVANN